MPEPSSAWTAGPDHGRIDADGADRRRVVLEAERGDQIVVERPARLGAEARHPARRVVAGQRRQVEAGPAPRTSHAAWWSFLTERRPDRLAVRRSTHSALTAINLEPRRLKRDARVALSVVAGPGGRRRDMARLVHL